MGMDVHQLFLTWKNYRVCEFMWGFLCISILTIMDDSHIISIVRFCIASCLLDSWSSSGCGYHNLLGESSLSRVEFLGEFLVDLQGGCGQSRGKGLGKAQGFGGEWISFVVILDGQPIEHN